MMSMEIFILVPAVQNVVNLSIRTKTYCIAALFQNFGSRISCRLDCSGKYKDKILKLKLLHSTSSISIVNEAVANFLKSGKYEKHLQQLRRTLQFNYQNYVQTIAESFPEGTKPVVHREACLYG